MSLLTPLLLLHATAAAVGLLSGTLALFARKSGSLHRRAGTVFLGAMLTMAALGAFLAVFVPSGASVLVGLLTCYLVWTGWSTLKPKAPALGAAATAAAGGLAAVALALGADAAAKSRGSEVAPYLIFGLLAAFAATQDVRWRRAGLVVGPPRIARHLWRMSAALLIADFSLFIGRQKDFPAAWRGSPVLFLPELATLAILIFWLVRVRTRVGYTDLTRNRRGHKSRRSTARAKAGVQELPPGRLAS